ncbi:MAG: hypothetical protein Q4D02_03925 [Clostridia bacterium]|nr:hypothetical protein [Clostridia bacterium]
MFGILGWNDYGYCMKMRRYFMFKDPKMVSESTDAKEYQIKVVKQVKEDIARLYCCDGLMIAKEEIKSYLENGYNIIGIKIVVANDMMHPMFYRFTKSGVKRKNINQRVQSFKNYPENIGMVNKDGMTTIDSFVAFKEAA